jgi:hypothetical protein
MFITEDDLVESSLFCYESYFDHMITTFNDLHGKHLLHSLNRMCQHLVFLSFIDDFEHTLGISGAVESELNIVFRGLKHDGNDRRRLIHFNDCIMQLASFNLMRFWKPNLHVQLAVRYGVETLHILHHIFLTHAHRRLKVDPVLIVQIVAELLSLLQQRDEACVLFGLVQHEVDEDLSLNVQVSTFVEF